MTGEGIDVFLRTLADRLRSITTVVELAVPVRPRRRAGGDPPRGRGRLDDRRARATCASGPGCRTPRPAGSPSSSSPRAGRDRHRASATRLRPAAYPYDRLDRLAAARRRASRAAPSTSRSARRSTRRRRRSSPPSSTSGPSAATRRASARAACARPSPAGSTAASTSPCRSAAIGATHRHQGVRRHAAAVAAPAHARTATRCCTRRRRTRPTRWGRSSPGAGRSPCR